MDHGTFDLVNESFQNITIAGILFVETEDSSNQYLVINIDRPSGNMSGSHVNRYYIYPTRVNGYYWTKHGVTVDVIIDQFQIVVGHIQGKPIMASIQPVPLVESRSWFMSLLSIGMVMAQSRGSGYNFCYCRLRLHSITYRMRKPGYMLYLANK